MSEIIIVEADLEPAIIEVIAEGPTGPEATVTSEKIIDALGFTPLANSYVPSWGVITGKPTFSTVAISGSYNDLSDKPSPYSLPTGSTTTLGGFKIDGVTITVAAGVLSAVGDVSDYTALRAHTGGHTALRVSGYTASGAPLGINGLFTVDTADTASADNGGTVIVADNGKRWKRVYNGNIDVRWFGAKGDGVTVDQTALSAAIALAYSTGEEIDWASGTYVSTANLVNFHSVRHTGSGIIKRGSNLFYVKPIGTQLNNLFVSTAGSDTNDGLSSSYPITAISVQTVIKACNTLYGQWYVNYAAGTYDRGIFLRGIQSTNRIVFAGPSVGGHPNVPTAVFDGTTSAEQAAFFFQRMNVQVQNVKCQNFISSAVGYGICADEFTSMLTVNVHTTGNQYGGICVDNGSVGRISGGIHNANVFMGLRAHDNSMVTFGYQGSSGSNRPVISNNPIGIAFLSGAQGHVDYTDISNSSQYGVTVEDCSRVHVAGTTITASTIADIRLNGNSFLYNDPVEPNTLSSTVPIYEDNVSSAQSLSSYVKTQFDKTSSASYSGVPGLEINLVAGNTYIFKATLSVTSGASGGVACALGGTATASSVMAIARVYNGTTIAHAQKTTSRTGAVGSYTGIATEVEISGTIVCSGSGTLIIRFAQNASNATASSVLVNSSLSAIKLK